MTHQPPAPSPVAAAQLRNDLQAINDELDRIANPTSSQARADALVLIHHSWDAVLATVHMKGSR